MTLQKISVVITLYHGSNIEHVLECFDSINNQTCLPGEVILVFDGYVAEDLLSECHKYLFYSPIKKKLIKNENNQGPGHARNIGVNASSFDYIAIMDSDDICHFKRFEMQLNTFFSENVDVVGGQINEFKELLDEQEIKPSRKIYFSDEEIKINHKKTIPVNNVTAMFRKKTFLSVGGYPELRFGEDLVLWYRFIALDYKFVNIDSVLVNVRLGEDFLERRLGMIIFKKEYKYLSLLYKENFLSRKEFFFKIVKSFLIRNIPKKLYTFLREKLN